MDQAPIMDHPRKYGRSPGRARPPNTRRKEAESYKKMYSHVHIRTSRKRKASGLLFGDFHERALDRKKADSVRKPQEPADKASHHRFRGTDGLRLALNVQRFHHLADVTVMGRRRRKTTRFQNDQR